MRISRSWTMTFVVVLAGCGAPAPASQTIDVCALLSQAEVGAATGLPFGPGRAENQSCNWDMADGSNLDLTFYAESASEAQRRFDYDRKHAVAASDLTGIGDAAFVQGDSAGSVQIILSVRSKGRFFAVIETAPAGRPSLDALKQLALTVVSRLPPS
ncbi:MAG: hypothetical protein IT381_10220 [Deltaproteobacteria bacterium]|nr:hypothetical protein [Deltaproteobacteria bacterium]